MNIDGRMNAFNGKINAAFLINEISDNKYEFWSRPHYKSDENSIALYKREKKQFEPDFEPSFRLWPKPFLVVVYESDHIRLDICDDKKMRIRLYDAGYFDSSIVVNNEDEAYKIIVLCL